MVFGEEEGKNKHGKKAMANHGDGENEEEEEEDDDENDEAEEVPNAKVGLAGKKGRQRFAINKSYSIEVSVELLGIVVVGGGIEHDSHNK